MISIDPKSIETAKLQGYLQGSVWDDRFLSSKTRAR